MNAIPRSVLAALCASTLLVGCGGADEAADTVPTTEAASEPAETPSAPAEATPATDAGQSDSATGTSASFPVTVETCGTEVTYEDAPSTVVVGWPTIITTMEALGVEDTVIGYTSADFAPAPDTDAEAISPDFRTSREVMTATGLDMFVVNDENQISGEEGSLSFDDLTGLDAGAYVLGGYCLGEPAPTDLAVVYDDIAALGTIFGVPEEAAAVTDDLRARVEAAATRAAGVSGTSAAVVQVFDGTLYALSGSYYAMIPEALGMDSVFADIDANFAEISPEEVLTLSPDTVIVVHDGDDAAADAAVAEMSELLAGTPAVTEGRVATVVNGQLSGGGVSVVEVIEDVADQLS